jgi:hypothetical protein
MDKFVFRNNTLERFFNRDYHFSGYDDISYIPNDVDFYVWWYQIPIKFDLLVLTKEIQDYISKLDYVISQVDKKKNFIILTIDILYSVQLTEDSYEVQKAVSEYNQHIYELEQSHANVKVIDIAGFYRKYSAK